MKGIFGTGIFKGSIRGVFEGMLRVSSIGVLGYIEGYIILAWFSEGIYSRIFCEGIFVVVRVYWRVYLWVYLLLAYTRSFIGGYI